MSALVFPLRESSATAESISAPFRLGYRPWLDGVRGIAILLVLVHHLQQFAFTSNPAILSAGFLGVDVFFVLSGFLITALLLEEWDTCGDVSLRNFYARRFLRLIPALIVFLMSMCIYAALLLPKEFSRDVYLSSLHSLFYSTNWINAFRLAPVSELLGHTWSLAMEEQFYLLWPLVLLVLLRARLARSLVVVAVVTLVVLICAHRISLVDSGAWAHRVYSAPDTRADSLLIGCVAAMLVSWGFIPTSQTFLKILRAASFASVLIVIAYLRNLGGIAPDLTLHGFGSSVFGIAIGILLVHAAVSPPRLAMILETRGLVWLGRVSYGVYLWHLPVFLLVGASPAPVWAKVTLSTALTLAFTSCSYYIVERPFLKLKKRFAVTSA